LSDASTQTTNDVSTQTEEESTTSQVRTKLVDIVNVKQTNNASTGMDSNIIGKIKSLSLELDEVLSKKGATRSPDNIFTDLNDLETEIAKIRYKALSIKESIEWLEREKNSFKRPMHPVLHGSGEFPVREKDVSQAFLPVGAKNAEKGTHTKIKDKRAFSVPVVLTTAIRERSDSNTVVRCGPDQTKKGMQISEASVFCKPVPSRLANIRRHSKSLGDLPELSISFQDNRYKVEPKLE